MTGILRYLVLPPRALLQDEGLNYWLLRLVPGFWAKPEEFRSV